MRRHNSFPIAPGFCAVLQAMALLFVLSCQDASHQKQSVGLTLEAAVDPVTPAANAPKLDPKARLAAIEAHRKAPTAESSLALARTYFPEFAAAEVKLPEAQRARTEAHALSVNTDGRALELITRGHTFRIESRTSAAKLQLGQDSAQVEEGHFLAPASRYPSESAAWKTPRVEEYWVRDAASGSHHAEYDVTLPKEITRVHDAGEYLEFLDAAGVPVLRFHPSVVRDAEGRTRTGTVELAGADRVGDQLYAITGPMSVATSVSLEGLAPPLVVDPGWSSTASMATPRYSHTTTLLPSGKMLVAGGFANGTAVGTAELYEPTTNTWSAAGSLASTRAYHTATLLPSGKVLVASGLSTGPFGSGVYVATAELYDPATNTWSAAGSLLQARYQHIATLLPSGKVLVAGGFGKSSNLTVTTELYDPATNMWTPAADLALARAQPTATLLPSGNVLVAGGLGQTGSLTSVELYDPVANTWSAAGSLSSPHYYHSATMLPSGKVLVAGGTGNGFSPTAAAELYDPATNTWSATSSLATDRTNHTATLLPSGNVLVAGGVNSDGYQQNTVELYDPGTNTWSPGSSLATARLNHTATLLPSGQILIAGGSGSSSFATTELYDPGPTTAWTNTASYNVGHAYHTTTLLPSGKVLVAAGMGTNLGQNILINSADLYDPATNTWSAAASLTTARRSHTATLLRSGKVLVAGGVGSNGVVATAELYDPATNTWSGIGGSASGHAYHTATLLLSGKVLVVSGIDSNGNPTAAAELYDSGTNTWSTAGSLATARYGHTATLLPSGKVLVAGGANQLGSFGAVATAELYDPATNTWSAAGSLASLHANHSATLLLSGKVLVAGGYGSNGAAYPTAVAELYDPATDTWSAAGNLLVAHHSHTATLLPSGKVLVASGFGSADQTTKTELYDPSTNTWGDAGSFSKGIMNHAATLLPSGKVLVMGGLLATQRIVSDAMLYDETGAQEAWRPVVTGPASLDAASAAVVIGTGFRGISGGSNGMTNDSPANFPLVRFRSLVNEQVWTLPGTAMSATSVTVTPPDAPSGYYLLTVTANGITGGSVVSFLGNEAPVISGTPSNQTIEATGPNGAVVSWTAPTATDDRDATATVTCVPASGGTFAIGTATVSCTATDSMNKSGTSTFTVTVRDTTAPAITVPGDLTHEATGPDGVVVSYSVSATDLVDGTTTVTCTPDSGSTFAIGAAVVTCESTDSRGNTATSSFNVTVSDTTKPTVSCPANLTIEATSAAGASATFSATATDLVTASPTFTYSPDSGSTFVMGPTTVTATAKDAANNTDSCTFTVTVEDTTKPTITCGSNVTVEATSSAGAVVTYTDATSTDATSTPIITYSQPSGDTFAQGTTVVLARATDAAGNNAACTFEVTVQDTTAPELLCPQRVLAEATGENGALVTFDAPVTSDLVSTPTLTTSQASMTQFPLGDTLVEVTSTDAANNKATCRFTVTVQDTTAPELTCPDDLVEEATGADGALVTYLVPATDLASTPTVTASPESMTQFPLGDTTVSVSAEDVAGNKTDCSFAVKVHDTTAPTLVVPADLMVEATSAEGAVVSFPAATATDLVTASPTIAYDHASGTQLPLGTTTVTVTATDTAENVATETFRVTVADTTAPQIQCPANVEVTAADASGATVTLPAPVVLDAVTAEPTVTFDHAQNGTYPVGSTKVVATATDQAGNKATCEFEIKVNAAPKAAKEGGCSSASGSTLGALVVLTLMLARRRTFRIGSTH